MSSPVFRQIAFPLNTFDYLKSFQRTYADKHGVTLNNNQALAVILAEHQHQATNEESTVQNETTTNPTSRY